MTISSATYGGGYSARSIQSGSGPKMPDMKEMQSKLAELKKSNPDLAAKMEKIGERMQTLQKSGVNQKDAMATIEKEFGKPSESEMKALGGPPAGASMGSMSKADIMSLLKGKSQNSSILDLLGGQDYSKNDDKN